MSSERDNIRWTYPLLQVSLDRSSTRPNVQPGSAWKMTGVDGILRGGLRPFPGFKVVHEIDYLNLPNGSAQHGRSSELLDVFPVSFIIGNDGYGYGFVYRMRRKDSLSSSADIYIDYFSSQTNTWTKGFMISAGAPLDVRNGGKQMDVAVFGRLIYVFVEGEKVAAFYTTKDSPYTPSLVGTSVAPVTGPGRRPKLSPPDQSVALGSELSNYLEDERDVVGQIRLLEAAPSAVSLGLGGGTSTTDGRTGQKDTEVRKIEPGDYAFAFQLVDSATGRKTPISDIATARAEDFDIDVSSSGGASATTVRPSQYTALQIDYNVNKFDQAWIYRSVRVQDAGGTYVAGILHLDRIINLSEFQTVNVGTDPYDSTTQGSQKAQAIYYYELEDKQLAFQDVFGDRYLYDEDMPKAGSALWYEGSLFLSSIPAGVASEADGPRPDDEIAGFGELRWSSMVEISPELFPPSNRYIPDIQADDILTMHTAYPNIIGFSGSRQYHLRKETTVVKVNPMHEGYGLVNQKAADSVGSTVYYMTEKGVKTTDSDGQLNSVRSLDSVAFHDWASSMASVSTAFDPVLNAIFFLCDDQDEAKVLWFNTAMVTDLEDMNFREVVRGPWPRDFVWDQSDFQNNDGVNNATYQNNLRERAFFVEKNPKDTSGEALSGFVFRIYVVDFKREKKQADGTTTLYSFLPYSGDDVWTLTQAYQTGNTVTVDNGSGNVPSELWNCELYVVESSTESLIGKRATIKDRSSSTFTLKSGDASELYGLMVGDKVAISPVKFEWVGHPLGVQSEDEYKYGPQADYFRQRYAQAAHVALVDVQGSQAGASDAVDRFQATLWRGNESTPTMVTQTFDESGALVSSLTENDLRRAAVYGRTITEVGAAGTGERGSSLSPGIRIICPNIDFTMLSCQISGKMEAGKTVTRGGS